jgi:hypothetical protein
MHDFAETWFGNVSEQGYTPVRGTLVRGEDDEIRITFDKDGAAIIPEEPAEKPKEIDLSLPDPAWTVPEMNEYGYTAEDMFPLSVGRALELFDAGHTIYLLYPDNTEAMAFDRDEARLYDGLCGIERNDWENSPVYKAQLKIAENSENGREADLLFGDKNKFGIYQIRDDLPEARNFRLASMKELDALGLKVDRDNYSLVYAGELPIRDTQTNLHRLFNVFQHDSPECPADFTFPSVSVGDVIVLQWRGEVSAHFVDSAGFVELPSFTGNEREQPPQTLYQIDTTSPAIESAKSESAAKTAPLKSAQKSPPSLLGELAEAKRLVARGGQQTAKQSEREV